MALLSFGARLQEALKAADDAGRARHLDHGGRRPLRQAAGPRADPPSSPRQHQLLLTIEEGSIGGFGSFVQQFMLDDGPARRRASVRLRSLVLPDRFIEHGTPPGQCEEVGLDARGIVAAVMRALGGAQRPVAVRAGAA